MSHKKLSRRHSFLSLSRSDRDEKVTGSAVGVYQRSTSAVFHNNSDDWCRQSGNPDQSHPREELFYPPADEKDKMSEKKTNGKTKKRKISFKGLRDFSRNLLDSTGLRRSRSKKEVTRSDSDAAISRYLSVDGLNCGVSSHGFNASQAKTCDEFVGDGSAHHKSALDLRPYSSCYCLTNRTNSLPLKDKLHPMTEEADTEMTGAKTPSCGRDRNDAERFESGSLETITENSYLAEEKNSPGKANNKIPVRSPQKTTFSGIVSDSDGLKFTVKPTGNTIEGINFEEFLDNFEQFYNDIRYRVESETDEMDGNPPNCDIADLERQYLYEKALVAAKHNSDDTHSTETCAPSCPNRTSEPILPASQAFTPTQDIDKSEEHLADPQPLPEVCL